MQPNIKTAVNHYYGLGFCWLLFLAPMFFLTYGQVNQWTAGRSDIGHMFFAWEKSMPFLPWTIVPYWSIDLLYGLSLFICTSKQELMRHGLRLLTASLVACIGFLLFPLQFSFVRPETHGLFGWLFQQLAQFDLPYNQAPSLHVMLAWLLGLRFYSHVTGWIRAACSAWFVLIALSVLTTYQHHVIDVISGLMVAIMVSYLLPIQGQWGWCRPTKHALKLAIRYLLASLVCALLGWWLPYGYLCFWPALSLLIVAAAYAGFGTAVFQKNPTGSLSISARLILAPYLLGTKIFQRWYCQQRIISPNNQIVANIWLGSFPHGQGQYQAVLDVTAELHHSADSCCWVAYPLMDLNVPAVDDLYKAALLLGKLQQNNDKVLVCCALGLSRSATVMAAFLLLNQYAASVEQALTLIRAQRPQIILTPAHVQQLEVFKATLCQTPV